MDIKQYIESINKQKQFTYKGSLSVSKCIETLKNPFDSERVANEMYQKYYNQEGNKYYHMLPDEIIRMWEQKRDNALSRGKLFDSYVEQILEIRNPNSFSIWKLDNDIDNNEFMEKAIKGFNNVISYLRNVEHYDTIIGTEIPLWIQLHNSPTDYFINGRCDCLLYNSTTKSYLIIDWKTNDEIKTSGFKNLKGPLIEYKDCDYNCYLTQLFFYKKALVETYKLTDYLHINVAICQVGTNNENNYTLYKPGSLGYNFDTTLMNRIIQYCHSIREIKEKELSI